jgi:hypothetical protein
MVIHAFLFWYFAYLGYQLHPDTITITERVPFIVEYQNSDCFLPETGETIQRLTLADVERVVE